MTTYYHSQIYPNRRRSKNSNDKSNATNGFIELVLLPAAFHSLTKSTSTNLKTS